ncbi:alpha/beta hydrolase [Nitriliruptoraceae bacterium ZYF776]|nr:alpha/beta hydrolase [Profundirhabdus halotolerans]
MDRPARTGGDGAPAVNDVRALAALAGHHLDRTVLGTVRDVHRGVADRVFRAVPGSTPVRWAHDAISATVYGAVGLGVRTLAVATDTIVEVAAGEREVRWLDGSPGRRASQAVLHGIVGDGFATAHPELDLPVRIRVDDRDVPLEPPAIATAFPDARRRVAVLLHGLTESERSWDLPARERRRPEGTDAVVLPDVLTELGWTPVRVRYGTGRAVGVNGVELAELLEALLEAWPQPVDELALVGHSMGGLVIRAACAVGEAADHRWLARVGHTVHLGTPHLGSWLERAAHRGAGVLKRFPETSAFGRILDTRARGIKDLRHGALDDAAWGEGVLGPDGTGDLDGLPVGVGATAELPPLPAGATHHLVAGRLTRSPDHPVTRVLGDLLVTVPSATGRDGRRELTGGRLVVLELPAGHFRLLRDPLVADHLRQHLA